MLKLRTDLEVYYKKENSNELVSQTSSTVVTPYKPLPYVLFFANHIFEEKNYPTKLIEEFVKRDFIVIYFTDKIRDNFIISESIIYIKAPWRYFDIGTIKNINAFSCVSGVGNRGKRLALQYASQFRKMLIKNIGDIDRVKKNLIKDTKKTTILFDTIYQVSDRGLGDILMTTPILEGLKNKFNAEIVYACRREAVPLLKNNPIISKIITKYADMDGITYTYHLPLIRHTENYKIKRNRQNRIDSMAELFMVELADKDKKPRLYLTETELEWGKQHVQDHSKINLGINIEATAPSRRWIPEYLIELIKLLDKDFNMYIFGKGNRVNYEKKLPAHIKSYIGKTTLRQMCALTYRMDMVLSVDSLYSHIAAAFDIPSVVLYTSIPAEWRNKYYRSIGIQGTSKCCPCMDFQFMSKEDYDKCDRFGTPPCMKGITPSIVEYNLYKCIKKYGVKSNG